MVIKKETKELAKIFEQKGATLYLVGGQVRDEIMKVKTSLDIDITSKLKTEDFKDEIISKGFSIHKLNKTLGSVTIEKNGVKMEYTAFRKEKYLKGHTPLKVKLDASQKEDSLRRDFTMNAIYYDILKNKYVDLLGGIDDIKKKTIRIVSDNTFNDDGLRLLRLCRFAGELNFKVDQKTIEKAKVNINNIDDISKERIYKEICLINEAKSKHGIGNSYSSYALMEKIGLIDKLFVKKGYIFPKQNLKYFKTDGIDYLSLLIYLIYKENAGIYSKKILKELKADNKTINKTAKICELINHIKSSSNFEENVIKYQDVIIDAIQISSIFFKDISQKYLRVYNKLNKNSLLNKKCVNIKVEDLIKVGVKEKNLGYVLDKLHVFVAKDIKNNTKEKLIEETKRYI